MLIKVLKGLLFPFSNPKVGAMILCTFIGFWMIIVGIMLCCTIILIPFGIVLIGTGLGMPIGGLFCKYGECPHCSSKIVWNSLARGFNCKVCRKRVIVKNNKLVAIM